ncbi:beta-galactosidase [Blautia liquoris]|uniref:Beta-galactosidase n=1 Tax=Blautia liquoris TaxID=2779518 RepID=A0A7M2REQ2_9FIRM|nr:beta-galactosidase [Blautia liquoris]QOV18628.1 beta-galactosidase [Blautia liquoris]
MEKNILFPQIGGLVHGGDYNPEQWLDRPDILEKDIEMMKKAGINCVTLGIFAWSVYEPREGEFHFGWMKRIMDNLYANGIFTILGTPSGARPAWLDEAYPEAMRVNRQGIRNHHGGRHNHCMTSPKFREKVTIIDKKLAENFGNHPGLLLWHVSNELGGECYCPLCIKRFQDYLAEKFHHDIDELNKAWWTTFWSHNYNSFDQIEPPFLDGERSIMGLNLEWKRFTTWNMKEYLDLEIQTLRRETPDVPVTTNFMQLYNGLDYDFLSESIDIISWDSYPRFHNDYESLYDTMAETAFHHTVMRSLKKNKPFMLMESAPGLVNWHPFNKLKRPGIHMLSSLQAIACGSDTVQYFQWRKGRGSFEQYHGAVIDHLGRDDTRIFNEVSEVGDALEKLSEVAGTTTEAKAALLFDWDTRWAIQDVMALGKENKQYEKVCMDIWKEFLKLGVEMDVISSSSDFSKYRLIVAPMLYVLKKGTAARLREFVQGGGQLFATYFTGYVDENLLCFLGGFPGDGLSELFGTIIEEIDTLYPSDRNRICFEDETIWEVRDCAETMRVNDAKILARYMDDFYRDTPALTCKKNGTGKAYYLACRVPAHQMQPLFKRMLSDAEIEEKELPEGVEYHMRAGAEAVWEFYLNHNNESAKVSGVYGTDILSGSNIDGNLLLEKYQAVVIRR